MRIIRAVSTDGHMIIGDDHGDGSATLLLDPAGLVSPGEDHVPEGAPSDAAELAALNGKRGLVADDDDTMRETVCAVLNRFGCETIPCRDGDEARKALESPELDIDLVVSDIAMPHANGYEVFTVARNRRPNMPVILITGFGYDPNHSLVRATKEGLGATLYKPFTPEQLVEQVREALRAAQAEPSSLVPTTESSRFERLLAPVVPRQVLCIGRNFAALGDDPDPLDVLEVFMKPVSSVIGPNDPIRLPRFEGIDPVVEPEGELAIVISRAASRITEEQALDHVLGLTIANDITARRWQSTTVPSPWMRGKGFDTFCPIGPAVVTIDGVADVDDIAVRTTVNGRTVREGSSGSMIRRVRSLISALSDHVTLVPGTVILTGAPPRVDTGVRALRPGDEVAVEIEGIGRLENTVAPEPNAP